MFIDTNVFVYAFLDSEAPACHVKHLKAAGFLRTFHTSGEVIISTQVLSEYYSVFSKNKIDDTEIQGSCRQLPNAVEVVALSKKNRAEFIRDKKPLPLQPLGFVNHRIRFRTWLHRLI